MQNRNTSNVKEDATLQSVRTDYARGTHTHAYNASRYNAHTQKQTNPLGSNSVSGKRLV